MSGCGHDGMTRFDLLQTSISFETQAMLERSSWFELLEDQGPAIRILLEERCVGSDEEW